jgi:hypothetical protein
MKYGVLEQLTDTKLSFYVQTLKESKAPFAKGVNQRVIPQKTVSFNQQQLQM